jgi:hypothetical protein
MSPLSTEEFFKWQSCAQSSYALNASVDSLVIGSKETMNDTVTPNFSSLQRKGLTVFNDMSYEKQESVIVTSGTGGEFERDAVTITCSGIGRKFSVKHDGNWFARLVRPSDSSQPLSVFPVHSSSDVQELQKEVSTRCLARRGMSDSNLFESVAEIRQTLKLIKRPLDSLNKLLSRASSLKGRAKSASEAWLTYRYGVMPVVRDIGAVIQGLKEKVGNVRRTTRASGNLSRYAYSSQSYVLGSPAYTLLYGIQKTDEVIVRAMSLDEYVVSLYENIGFTTKGLVTLPWELIPYSFVADWFVNLGDFLQALVPLPGVQQLGSCLTTRRVITNIYSPISMNRSTYVTLRQISGSCLSRLTTKVRTQLFPPSLVVKSDFKFDDATRLADSLALIVQKMGRVFR